MSRGRLGVPRPAVGVDRARADDGRHRARARPHEGARFALDDAGVLLGLLLVALLFGALIGPQFFRPGQPRADGAPDRHRLRRRARHDDGDRGRRASTCRSDRSSRSPPSSIALLLRERLRPVVAALGRGRGRRGVRAVNGVLVTGLRVVPFIVTLGTMLLIRGAAKGLADERRIEAPITWLNDLLRTVRDGSGLLLPWGIWVVAAAGGRSSPVTLQLHAVRPPRLRDRIERAHRAAVRRAVERSKIAVYALAGGASPASPACCSSRSLSVGDPTVGDRPRARRHRGRHHRRRQPVGRQGHRLGTLAGAGIMTVIQIGCAQQGLAELGAADRHRRHHRVRGRARSLAVA